MSHDAEFDHDGKPIGYRVLVGVNNDDFIRRLPRDLHADPGVIPGVQLLSERRRVFTLIFRLVHRVPRGARNDRRKSSSRPVDEIVG